MARIWDGNPDDFVYQLASRVRDTNDTDWGGEVSSHNVQEGVKE